MRTSDKSYTLYTTEQGKFGILLDSAHLSFNTNCEVDALWAAVEELASLSWELRERLQELGEVEAEDDDFNPGHWDGGVKWQT